ncbi:hypothetical protein N9891_02075, partial [bacterium]|nr:hypothetical protein [bacterium]
HVMTKKFILPLAFFAAIGIAFYALVDENKLDPAGGSSSSDPSGQRAVISRTRSISSDTAQLPSSKQSADSLVQSSEIYQAALAEARGPDGSLPQGEPVLPAPSDQVIDDPRDHGGIIIPLSNKGVYVPGEKAELTVTSGEKSGVLTPNQNGNFPMMVIIPFGKASLSLSYPNLPSGSDITLTTPDGGLINGERDLVATLDQSGSIKVKWEGDHNLGHHTIVAKAGPRGDRKIVRFWVGPRSFADSSSAYAEN